MDNITAEDYFFTWFDDNSNSPDLIYNHAEGTTGIDTDNVIKLLKEFAKLKCQEQRQLCTDNAEMTIEDYYPDGTHDVIDKGSILNAPEPKL